MEEQGYSGWLFVLEWWFVSYGEFVHFTHPVELSGLKLFLTFPDYPRISVEPVGTTPPSCLVLLFLLP